MVAKLGDWFLKASHRWRVVGLLLPVFFAAYIIGTLISWQHQQVSETIDPSFIPNAFNAGIFLTVLMGLKYAALTIVSSIGKYRRVAVAAYSVALVAGLAFDIWITSVTVGSNTSDIGLAFLAFNVQNIAYLPLAYLVLYLIIMAVLPKEKRS